MTIRKILAVCLLAVVLAGCAAQPPMPAVEPSPTSDPGSLQQTAAAEPAALPTDLPLPTITPTDAPTPTSPPVPTPTTDLSGPPGIILFIGDGMGPVQRQAATWLALGQSGTLVMDSLPVHGWAQTASADDPITDSAAAATAIATGHLTNNGMLAVDPQGNPLETILEMAEQRGMATGLVTTVPMAHATPAAFAAHFSDRSQLPVIAGLMVDEGVDVLLGGGEDDFLPRSDSGCYPGGGNQPNDNDLVAAEIAQGYTYICRRDQLLSLNTSVDRQVLGLFAGAELIAPFQPNLAEMTQTALEILSKDPDGFFLMVEAGQIDWASHENNAEEALQFTVGLDSAVTLAVIYTLDHPNTLLIVTADHETGGMSINTDGAGSFDQDGPFKMPDGTPFWVDWSTGSHTGIDIPVTARGPHSEMLQGQYSLTRIFETMRAMLASEGN